MHAGLGPSLSSPLPGFTGFVKARRQKSDVQDENIPTPQSALTYKAQTKAGSLETLGPVPFAQRVLCCRAVRHADSHINTLVPCPRQETYKLHSMKCSAVLYLPAPMPNNGMAVSQGCQLKSTPANAQRPQGYKLLQTHLLF